MFEKFTKKMLELVAEKKLHQNYVGYWTDRFVREEKGVLVFHDMIFMSRTALERVAKEAGAKVKFERPSMPTREDHEAVERIKEMDRSGAEALKKGLGNVGR